MNCYFCNSKMVWQTDADYREVYGDCDGIVRYFTCSNEECKADVEVSRKYNKGDEKLNGKEINS